MMCMTHPRGNGRTRLTLVTKGVQASGSGGYFKAEWARPRTNRALSEAGNAAFTKLHHSRDVWGDYNITVRKKQEWNVESEEWS